MVGDRKHVVKFRVDRVYSFEDIFSRKFHKLGLKRLFAPSPKNTFLRVSTPRHNTSSSRPKWYFLIRGKHVLRPSRVEIGPAVWPGRGAIAKNTKTTNEE